MPVYEYKCEDNHIFDRYLPLDRYNEPQICECGKGSKKVLTGLYVQPDMEAYKSPIDGSYVGSRSQHRKHMKHHGVIEVGNEKLKNPFRKKYEPKDVAKDIVSSIRESGGN
jgi:hypothetical protein